jgi:hypothetical protein
LKTPSTALIMPSHHTNPPIGCGATRLIPISTIPMAMEVAGPAAAMIASSRGRLASPSSSVAPPKMKSVMPRTCMPNRRASTACDSSCATTEAKNRMAAAAPPTQ